MYQKDDIVTHTVERVQTGVRIEKRILKVMKALAEYHDLTLGDLIEGIVLHAFEGKSPFGSESLKLINELKVLYHLDLDASASHKLIERKAGKKNRP
jgi:predicted DNA-binding ribbon-helix-helix protein